MKRLEISNWLSKLRSKVRSGSILLDFLVSDLALFNLSVIRSRKGGIRVLVLGELGLVIQSLFEEGAMFLGIATNGNKGWPKRMQ